MSTTKEHVLSIARGELNEEEIPHGSNNVKYSRWYGLIGPWCGMFVSWVAAQAGATDIIPRFAYTPSGAAWFQRAGRWSRTPHPGAIVFYEFPGIGRISHTGIVETVYSNGDWVAIEGNTDEVGGRTGGKVLRRYRSSVGHLGGFGNPLYLPSTPPVIVAGTVKGWQTLLEFGPPARDGQFGADTLQRSEYMRTASRRINEMPGNTGPTTLKLIQRIVDVKDDGDWGPKTEAGVRNWIKQAQHFFGVTADGEWGPKTDAAYVAFRTKYYRR